MKIRSALLFSTVLLSACSKPETRSEPQTKQDPPQISAKKTDSDVEYATNVPGKPGFAQSPYAPEKGYVDVRGYPKDTEVRDPYTGRMFLIPDPEAAAPESIPSGKPIPAEDPSSG